MHYKEFKRQNYTIFIERCYTWIKRGKSNFLKDKQSKLLSFTLKCIVYNSGGLESEFFNWEMIFWNYEKATHH